MISTMALVINSLLASQDWPVAALKYLWGAYQDPALSGQALAWVPQSIPYTDPNRGMCSRTCVSLSLCLPPALPFPRGC